MASELTLRQVRYFLAALEGGSMAEAGRRLHVSASAVSLAVAALEQAVGADLLIRTPHRPLALTVTGGAVVGDLRRLINASEDLVATASDEAHQASGVLRVGCFRTLAPTYVPPLVAEVGQVYPAIDLRIEELSLEELQDSLLDGQLELAILYDLNTVEGIATETLALTKPYILLSADHRLANRKRIRLAELRDEPMVMLDVPPSKEYFEAILADHDIAPPISRTTGSVETLRSLVARDQGWSMLIQKPRISTSYEALPIRAVAITDRLEPMPIIAAWTSGTRLTHRAELLLSICRRTVAVPVDER